MKILFASMPADGHFNPLTPIAVHLAERGNDVRWYAGPLYAPKVEALGQRCYPYVAANEITTDNIKELFPERSTVKGPKQLSFDLDKFFVGMVEGHFADIAAIHAEWPFDVFFCDGALYAEKLVADCLDVPVFAVGLATVLPTGESPPPFFGLRPARSPLGKVVHAVVRRMLAGTMRPGVARYNAVLAAHGVAPIRSDGFPDAPMAVARRVFLNGCPGMEYPGYRPPPNAEFVGPLTPVRTALAPSAPLPPAVLARDATVIAVSQGTVDNTDPTKLIAATLEAFADSPHVVIATTAGVQTEELRSRFSAPNLVVEDFVDYEALFPHVDVFVNSGGYGSMLAALRHSVPIVGAGKGEGKNDNNARVGYNRLGVDLRTERPTPAQIAAAVERVLRDPQIKAKVARVRDQLASYDPMTTIEKALAELA